MQISGNGRTINAVAVSTVHVGARLDEGVVTWARDTEQQALGLAAAHTRDAVEQYVAPDNVYAKVTETEATAATPVTDAVKTVELVSKTLAFSPEQQSTVQAHFPGPLHQGRSAHAAAILQAVTSTAQTVTDADLCAP